MRQPGAARCALRTYVDIVGDHREDLDTQVKDLLADLMHMFDERTPTQITNGAIHVMNLAEDAADYYYADLSEEGGSIA